MNGFSTLNRLLGKKSKSQTISKSTSNLSTSTLSIRPLSQYDTSATSLSSQLESSSPNAPLPNVPFEQTFRITVHLPKGQLYVARLGAKTDLEKLLMLVCENKQLDPLKYELRHPGNSSQVFGLDQTVGAVGLSEVRLCLKSESYDNFNTGEILTLRNTMGRDSLSSSEMSSRNSKHTLKTASPYSSTNSLNSSDSAGMSTYRGQLGYSHPPASLQSFTQHKPPVAPARKKRAAPRPPSQNSATLSNGEIQTTKEEPAAETSVSEEPPMIRKEFHVSTPNLTQCSEMTMLRTAEFHKSNVSVDCNGNSRNSRDNNSISNGSSNGEVNCNGSSGVESVTTLNPSLSASLRPASMSVLNNEILYQEQELNGNRGFAVNGSVTDLSDASMLPEPAPRKRLIISKKKAPAPPPRSLQPIATPRLSAGTINTPTVIVEVSHVEENPTDESVPNETDSIETSKEEQIPATLTQSSPVVMLSQVETNDTTPDKDTPPKPFKNGGKTELSLPNVQTVVLTNGHAHSPTPSEYGTPPSTPATPGAHPQLESKLSSEASSDDDENVKVYNIKLGKTIVQPIGAYGNHIEPVKKEFPTMPPTLPPTMPPTQLTNSLSVETESYSTPVSPLSTTSPQRVESPDWSYTIPAPPTFADNETVAATYRSTGSDRNSPMNGSVLSDQDDSLTAPGEFHNNVTITSDMEDGYRGGRLNKHEKTRSESIEIEVHTALKGHSEVMVDDFQRVKDVSPPKIPMETKADLITELTNVINGESATDFGTMTKRVENGNEKTIEAAKPSDLSNFTIQSYSKPSTIEIEKKEQVAKQIITETSAESEPSAEEPTESNGYVKSVKRPSLTLSNSVAGQISRQRANIARSDSFHSTRAEPQTKLSNLSQSRSASQMSLDKLQQESNLNGRFVDTNKRRSSSELSIGETPSLQSLIVMKSILGSRKNSLTNGNVYEELNSPEPLETIPATPTTPGPIEVKNTSVIETISTVYRRPSLKDFVSVTGDNTIVESVERKDCRNESLIENVGKQLLQEKETLSRVTNDNEPIPISNPDCDSSKENSPKNKIVSQTNMEVKPHPQPAEKIYRYQGPPSINLSTWSERPKSQVSIKSDNDYKFGIGTARARFSLGAENKPEPASRDIQKGPARVPFVRSVEYKNAAPLERKLSIENGTPAPQLAARPLSVNTSLMFGRVGKSNSAVETAAPLERKPSIENGTPAPQSAARPMSVNTSLMFGRVGKSNFVPVVKGFRSLEPNGPVDTNTTDVPKADQSQDSILRNPATVMRSNSAVSTSILRLSTGGANIQKIPINIPNKEPTPPPSQAANVPLFGQVSLRKTGFKEKILASQDTVDCAPKPRSVRSLEQQSNCAKLEMKITTTTAVPAAANTNPNITRISVNSNFGSSATINPEIPPPPPPIIRSVVTKQNSLGKSACIPDTRDQLLSAIRNFSKDALKRS